MNGERPSQSGHENIELGLTELVEAEQVAQQRARAAADEARPEAFRTWSWEQRMPLTGRLLHDRYDSPDRALAENWERALGLAAAAMSLQVPDPQLPKLFEQRHHHYAWGWPIREFLRSRGPEEVDPLRFRTAKGTFRAHVRPLFQPLGMQVDQMRQQLTPQSFETLLRLQPHYDTYGRIRPYPVLDDIKADAANLPEHRLEVINANHLFLMRGVDYDAADEPKRFDKRASQLLRAGIARAEKRIFSPQHSTLASIAIACTLETSAATVRERVLYIPSPKLPVKEAVPDEFLIASTRYIQNLEPNGWAQRVFGRRNTDYDDLLNSFTAGDATTGYPEARQLLLAKTRPLAERHLYPVVDASITRSAKQGAYLLDLLGS